MSYSPQELEVLIKQGKFTLVEQEIIYFIENASDKSNYIKLNVPAGMHSDNKDAYEVECNSIVAAYASLIVQMFCNAKYAPSKILLDTFLTHKVVLELLFSLSAWKTTDALIEKLNMLELLKFKKFQFTKKRMYQLHGFLALYCVGSKYRLPWKQLFHIAPELTLIAYQSMLIHGVSLVDKDRNRGFEALLHAAEGLPIIEIKNPEQAKALAHPYFYCSYTTSKNKYEIKKWVAKVLNHNAKRWLERDLYEFSASCDSRPISENPTIGVVLERYTKTHAMYRCYNARLAELSKEYKLVAIIERGEAQDADLSVFDHIEVFEPNEDINSIGCRIRDLEPDIMLYPSVGMSWWGMFLANIRFAPVQAMLGGHPSSSYSDAMDYFIFPGDNLDLDDIQKFTSEKAVVIDNLGIIKQAAVKHDTLTNEMIEDFSKRQPDKEVFTVGVNGVIQKVNATLISVCKEIEIQTTRPIKFIFFSQHKPYSLGFMATKAQLNRYIKNFELVSYAEYVDYLATLSRCELLLPTIPFGGSNSNIDAMIVKRPKLFIEGSGELYTRTDGFDWLQVDMYHTLCCKGTDELLRRAVEIIENQEVLASLQQEVNEKCSLDKVFFDPNLVTDSRGYSINPHVHKIIEIESSKLLEQDLMAS
ncbi:hypothetical protein [Glaciecola sp. KUL10]|uniref:hypothetical protein n=1 Tax=Glaciecola sp. (strain KUL10) TaxID=2161813 RepID=UPI000D781EA8|nr:hypothetical protein [Glaciecola sp. KUL10]GBL04000.1 hypothetical protein KUL10_13020 [Glaciecola sp. KUL10]